MKDLFKRAEETLEELEKRGVTAISQKKGNLFSKLNSLVRSKKLFKDTKGGKKVFVMR